MHRFILLILAFFQAAASSPAFAQPAYKFTQDGRKYLLEFISFHGIDSVEHFISFYEDGMPGREYFYKDGYYLDTLKRWFVGGNIATLNIYSDSGYTERDYFHIWPYYEEGSYRKIPAPPRDTIVDDSSTWTRNSVHRDAYKKPPYYVRTGLWKTFYPDGSLRSQGYYLPEEFYCSSPSEALVVKKGFNYEDWFFKTGKPFTGFSAGGVGYLKEGEWIYYDLEGQETHREFYRSGARLWWK